MLSRDSEDENLLKICVWTCDMTSRSYFGKMNSTLGSVVPLAIFGFSIPLHSPQAGWRLWPCLSLAFCCGGGGICTQVLSIPPHFLFNINPKFFVNSSSLFLKRRPYLLFRFRAWVAPTLDSLLQHIRWGKRFLFHMLLKFIFLQYATNDVLQMEWYQEKLPQRGGG